MSERPSGHLGAVTPDVGIRLDLAELLAAARLAGDVPLPVAPQSGDRWSRLTGAPDGSQQAVADAVAAGADPGPGGAGAALAARGLLVGRELVPGLAAAVQVLAVGPASVVIDLAVRRAARVVRMRGWLAAGPGLAARLATVDGLHYDLTWFEPRRWLLAVARAVTVAEWPVVPAAGESWPDRVVLPSELLLGAVRAHRNHRADLLPAMATTLRGATFAGPYPARPATPDELAALLRRLGECPGRLRLWAGFRPRDDVAPGVAAWLRLDSGWYQLHAGPAGSSVLRRGDPAALGAATWPLVRATQEVAA